VQNAYVVVDDQVVDLTVDLHYAFSYNVVVVNDEDAVALDQIVVANLSKNVLDHQDVKASFQMDQVHDVVASFYTYVDVVVVNFRHDVDYNVVALNQVDLTFDGVDSYFEIAYVVVDEAVETYEMVEVIDQ
jgi:hypothetical protein